MSRQQNTAEIINFETFRRQRTDEQYTPTAMTPVLVWVPMWVLVPHQMIQPIQ